MQAPGNHDTPAVPDDGDQAVEAIRLELANNTQERWRRILEKFLLAALGSIPWVGGVVSAAASIRGEESDLRRDALQTQWLEEHRRKVTDLRRTLEDISARFETLGSAIEERIQSEEYLTLVRRAFRTWDSADTEEKRHYVRNLISNSAGTRLCSDDVVRLFIDWLDLYHEAHFAVIREVYKNPASTRFDIWTATYGELPREDSAEADLFKLLVRDLSTGGVVRQERETNEYGQFIRRRSDRPRRRGGGSVVLESAFDDTKPYVLTELGRQFVHYTMNEVVPRLAQNSEES